MENLSPATMKRRSSCKAPIFSSDFNKLWSLEILSWHPQISRKYVLREQRWYMRTDGHEEANRRLLWQRERAQKPSENSWSGLCKLFMRGIPQYNHSHKFVDRMLTPLNRHHFQTDCRTSKIHCWTEHKTTPPPLHINVTERADRDFTATAHPVN